MAKWSRLLRVPGTAGRSNQSINPKGNQSWILLEGQMLKLKLQYFATWCKELTPWKRPWCWERLKAGGEWDDRGWDDWMASPTRWTWVWVSSGSWWRTRKPGVLQSMGLQSVGLNWATEPSGKESACQFRWCKRPGFNPWVKKIPWSKRWQPTLAFLPGESHGWRSLVGYHLQNPRVRHAWAQAHKPFLRVKDQKCRFYFSSLYKSESPARR